MAVLPNAVNDYIFNVDYYYYPDSYELTDYSCYIKNVYYSFNYYLNGALCNKKFYLGGVLLLPLSKIVTHTFLGYLFAKKAGIHIGLAISLLSFAYDVKKYNEIQVDHSHNQVYFHGFKTFTNSGILNLTSKIFKILQYNDLSDALYAIYFAETVIGCFEILGTIYGSQYNIKHDYPFINKAHGNIFDFAQLSIRDICDFENFLTLNNQRWKFNDNENFCDLDLTKTLLNLFNIPLKPNLSLCNIFYKFKDEDVIEALKYFKDKVESCKNDDLIRYTIEASTNKTIQKLDYLLENFSTSEGFNPLHDIILFNSNLKEFFLTKGIDYNDVDTLGYIIDKSLWTWIEPIIRTKANMTRDGYIARMIYKNDYNKYGYKLNNEKLLKFCELFIKLGADINQTYSYKDDKSTKEITPFVASLIVRNYEASKLLLNKGIATNQFTEYFKNNFQTLFNDIGEGKTFPYDYIIHYEFCKKELETFKQMYDNTYDRDITKYESSKEIFNLFCGFYKNYNDVEKWLSAG